VTLAPTGPSDVRDQRWLDERIAAIGDGIESVLDIARNWTDGRTLSRLHPGVSAKDYVLSHVKHPLGKGVVVPLLAESNWSQAQIAEVAGVNRATVGRELAANAHVERPTETLGADGKLRPSARPTPIRPRLDLTPDPYFAGRAEPRVLRTVTAEVIEEAPLAEPDTRLWDALVGVMDAIDALSVSDAPSVAATVPDRRRAASAKRLRKLGTYLGRIAWSLESEGEPE
jgi:hypothetical protein